MKRHPVGRHLAFVAAPALAAGVWLSSDLRAADHIDGYKTEADAKADIADLYAFSSPADGARVVLVLTVAPLTAAGNRATFDDRVLYQLHVDVDGDAVTDHSYRVRSRSGQVRVLGPGVDLQGAIGQTLSGGGVRFIASTFDDPAFIDLSGLKDSLDLLADKFVGVDSFAGKNVGAIVLELPKVLLRNGAAQTKLSLWATTSR